MDYACLYELSEFAIEQVFCIKLGVKLLSMCVTLLIQKMLSSLDNRNCCLRITDVRLYVCRKAGQSVYVLTLISEWRVSSLSVPHVTR